MKTSNAILGLAEISALVSFSSVEILSSRMTAFSANRSAVSRAASTSAASPISRSSPPSTLALTFSAVADSSLSLKVIVFSPIISVSRRAAMHFFSFLKLLEKPGRLAVVEATLSA